MALSLDLRQRILAAHESDKYSVRRIGEIFGVAKATVKKLIRLKRDTGSLVPRIPSPPALPIWTDTSMHNIVRDLVAEDNDATLAEYCNRLEERTGTRISVQQMCELLQQLKLYRKKKAIHASEGDCPRVESARKAWFEKIATIDSRSFVFIDETGVNLGMTRRYARAEGQARAHGSAPKSPGQNVSVIGSIRLDGSMTAMNFPGALDGEAFHVYAKEILCPTLRCGDIVVMDNLRVHQNKRVRDLIEACGAEIWYLPPYSPKFNPIEECWSKFKSILRTIAARTREALDDGISYALNAVTPSDARGWFEHSGCPIPAT
jgi:transposase